MADPIVLKRTLETLVGERSAHENTWRECYRFVHPARLSGFDGYTTTADDAQAQKARIMDSTAADAVRVLTSSIVGGLTPANSVWFQLDAGADTEEERRWLDDVALVIWKNIHAGNFDAAAFEGVTDYVDVGWFVLYTEEDPAGGLRFEQWPCPQCFVSSSQPGGLVDTIFRRFEMTVEQVVNKYGINSVSQGIREKYLNDKKLDKVKVCQAIYPRAKGEYTEGSKLMRRMPFASCEFEIEGAEGRLLLEQGYPEFPCAVPRWSLIPGSDYGMGPVSDALPDIKTVNEVKRLILANADLAIAGMWKATDDGVLNPATVTVGPRKIIAVSDMENMQPLVSGAKFDVADLIIKDLQASIRKLLMADQLQPQEGPAMTATEVHVRVQMIRQLLGPVYGRAQSEYLSQLVTRCFGIVYRAAENIWNMDPEGKDPEIRPIINKPPASLAGRSFHVRFVSPLARAQKMEEVNAVDAYLAGLVQAAAELQDVSIMDNVDMTEAQRARGEGLGVPNKVIPSDEQIASKRKARQAAQQKAQQAQQQQDVAAQNQIEQGKAAAQSMVAA